MRIGPYAASCRARAENFQRTEFTMDYQEKTLTLPLESDRRTVILGYTRTRDVRIGFGRGYSISSDLFYAAWQTAFDWKVSNNAVTIRNGKIVQGIRLLQSSICLLDETDDYQIVKRLRFRQTKITTVADLDTETLTLTVVITRDDERDAFEATFSDDDCEEIDFFMRTMERRLARHETLEEFRERLAEEAAEAEEEAAAAAADASKRANEKRLLDEAQVRALADQASSETLAPLTETE